MSWKLALIVLVGLHSHVLFAASAQTFPLQEAKISLNNKVILQRGAKYFVNYCLSCHSAQFSRYNRVGKDLGIPEDLVKKNLIFTQQKIGDLMLISMTDEESLEWFGSAPPDLTLIARSRGADWLYTYLKTFYLDESRPMGVNNAIFENVAMPHVLWELQGWQKPVYKEIIQEDGAKHKKIVGLKIVKQGKLSEKEYDRVVLDIVTFISYLSEPIAVPRKQMGIWVILFLLLLFGICYLLKKEYWKDIH